MHRLPRLFHLFVFCLTLICWLGATTAWSKGGSDSGKQIRLVTDPETTGMLEQLSKPLLRAAGLPEYQVKFHVILDSTLNAFALPNGDIVFHSALILSSENRDELAAVMAHEIGHLAAGHHHQLQESMKGISLQTLIATVVGVAAGVASGNSDVAGALISGGQAVGRSNLLAAIRQKEMQSDRLAIQYMRDAGYNPEGLVVFMERISREQRLSTLPPPYLLTHPVGTQRMMEAMDLIQAQSSMRTTAMRPDEESQNLARVRAKLEAGTSLEPLRAAESFRRRLVREPDRMDWRYGMALSQRYAGQLAEAEAGLSQLLTGNPRDPYLLRERGLTRLERGDLSHAEQDFRQALQHLPDNADLQYRLAFTLHEAGDATQATRLLYRLTSAHPTLDHAYYLLGLVEGEQGRLGYSHLALARHHRLKMDMDTASWHYDQALKHFPVDGRERKQVRREMALLKQQILERQRDQ